MAQGKFSDHQKQPGMGQQTDKSKMPGEDEGADLDTPTATADDDTKATEQSGVSGTIVEDGKTTTTKDT